MGHWILRALNNKSHLSTCCIPGEGEAAMGCCSLYSTSTIDTVIPSFSRQAIPSSRLLACYLLPVLEAPKSNHNAEYAGVRERQAAAPQLACLSAVGVTWACM